MRQKSLKNDPLVPTMLYLPMKLKELVAERARIERKSQSAVIAEALALLFQLPAETPEQRRTRRDAILKKEATHDGLVHGSIILKPL
jgi:hypothetical protein